MRRLPLLLLALAFAAAAAASPRVDSYVFVPHGTNVMSSNIDLQRALSIGRRYGSHFLWVRHDGREYVIRDAATLDAIERVLDSAGVPLPEMERLRAKMRPLEARERTLDHEVDAISDDENRSAADEARLRDLEGRLREVESQLRVLEGEEERLDREQDRLEEEAERKMMPLIERAIRVERN